MELDFISSEKAEGTAHTLLASPFMHMSWYGLEVMSCCAKIFGQGNLTAALCFAPSVGSSQRVSVVVVLVFPSIP